MAFELDKVVPWGRNLNEYKEMFDLSEEELAGKIAGFGDGPASFNQELTRKGCSVISFDPIYRFSKSQIKARILETRDIVMKQTKENQNNFIWTTIKSLEELENIRMNAMERFLEDFEQGRAQCRYIDYELPKKTAYPNGYFDLGLSSHFLLMYTQLGEQFHIEAISEMLRICKEVRIFPTVDLDGKASTLTNDIIQYFKQNYQVSVVEVKYHFQKDGNKMLKIKNRMYNN